MTRTPDLAGMWQVMRTFGEASDTILLRVLRGLKWEDDGNQNGRLEREQVKPIEQESLEAETTATGTAVAPFGVPAESTRSCERCVLV